MNSHRIFYSINVYPQLEGEVPTNEIDSFCAASGNIFLG